MRKVEKFLRQLLQLLLRIEVNFENIAKNIEMKIDSALFHISFGGFPFFLLPNHLSDM